MIRTVCIWFEHGFVFSFVWVLIQCDKSNTDFSESRCHNSYCDLVFLGKISYKQHIAPPLLYKDSIRVPITMISVNFCEKKLRKKSEVAEQNQVIDTKNKQSSIKFLRISIFYDIFAIVWYTTIDPLWLFKSERPQHLYTKPKASNSST